jgi:hypothetical protein
VFASLALRPLYFSPKPFLASSFPAQEIGCLPSLSFVFGMTAMVSGGSTVVPVRYPRF